MKAFWAFFALFAALHSANLSGSIYSMDSFDAVRGVVIRAEGASTYQTFSMDGTYNMDVPAGKYTVKAFYYVEGNLEGYAEDQITLGEGGAAYDFVLFAPDEFEGIVGLDSPEVDEEIPEQRQGWTPFIVEGAVLLAVIVAAAYFLSGKKKEKEGVQREEEELPPQKHELDEEEKKVLEILRNSEGMRSQKELREIMKCTEAKMSLLISGLEAQGYVKKIKKGRENIVKLKK